jgi:hypothetical protein
MTPDPSENAKSSQLRNTLILFGCILLLLINNLTGFLYYRVIDIKIERLEFDSTIGNDSFAIAKNKLEIDSLKKERHSYKSLTDNATDKVNMLRHSAMQKDKADLWFFLSTSGLYILCIVTLIPVTILSYIKKKVNDSIKFIIGILFMSGMLFIIMLITNYLLSKIPIIGGNLTWNYLLNFLFQLTIIASVFLGLLSIGKRNVKRQAAQS